MKKNDLYNEFLNEEYRLKNMASYYVESVESKSAYDTIINDFEKGKIDILVGTQMLSKGLDFDRVTLVGIVDLDRMLHFPDFRAFERTFQLSLQVSGRAGRREDLGVVVIQTKRIEQPILSMITKNDFSRFYQYELLERETHHYPPFTRLIKITVKNKDAADCRKTATILAENLRNHLGNQRVLGPQDPMVYKIRNYYLQDILVKLDRNSGNLITIKKNMIKLADQLTTSTLHKGSRVIFDVDPV